MSRAIKVKVGLLSPLRMSRNLVMLPPQQGNRRDMGGQEIVV